MENIIYSLATIVFVAFAIFSGSVLNESFMEKDFDDIKTLGFSLVFLASFSLAIFFATCVNF